MIDEFQDSDALSIVINDLGRYYRNDVAKNKKLKFHYHLTKTDIFSDYVFSCLSTSEKVVFLYFLYEYPRQDVQGMAELDSSEARVDLECGPSAIRVSLKRLHSVIGVQRKSLHSAIVSLQQKRVLTVRKLQNLATKERKGKESKVKKTMSPLKKETTQIGFDSLSIIEKPKLSTSLKPAKKASVKNKNSELGMRAKAVIARYSEIWKLKYGGIPTITKKEAGLIMNLCKSYSENNFLRMIETYFAMPDVMAVKKAHSVEYFNYNLKSIEAFKNTGKVVTRQAMQKAEQKVEIAQTAYDFTANMTPQEKREYYSHFPGYDENGNKIEESETKMLEAR